MNARNLMLLVHIPCRRANRFRLSARLKAVRKWEGCYVSAPDWSRWLKMFGFIDTLYVARTGLDDLPHESFYSSGVLTRTWFGLKAIRSGGTHNIILDEASVFAIVGALAVSYENARLRRIRDATARARALADRLDRDVPPGAYVTMAHRRRWRLHQRDAQQVVEALRAEMPSIRPRFARLASWADDPDLAAVTEREQAAQAAMQVHKQLLDSIERDPLTPTQRRAVVAAERRVAVNAGAGCGKTGTIIARAAYRVASDARTPGQILALTFTRKAAAEMRERFESTTLHGITASTYHSLAKQIALQHLPGRELFTPNKKEEAEAVQAVLNDLICDSFDISAAEFVIGHLYPSFVEPADGLRSDRSYIDYLKFFRLEALDRSAVRSPLEAALLNTLIVAGIPFRHRPRTGSFRPSVILDDGSKRVFDIQIVDRFGEPASFVPKSFQGSGGPEVQILKYELDGKDVDIRALRRLLQLPERLTADEIARIPLLTGYNRALERITKLVLDFMRRFRASAKSTESLKRFADDERIRSFLALYEMFETVAAEMLERASYVDFDGIIREATVLLESGRYRRRWRDLILDEYQDVSEREIRFLEALAKAHDADVFAVGDDWQAIYGFKGSAWDALQTFRLRFGGGDDVELYEYPETHRSVDAIHEPAGRFVRRNPLQTQKTLRSTRPPAAEPRVEIRGVASEGISDFATEQLARAALTEITSSECQPRDVLILARAKKHLLEEEGKEGSTTFKSLSIHRAKGLGADIAIITDAFSSFPGRRLADPLLSLVQIPETFKDAEERRIFYVAMTRARDRVIILTDWNRRSSFLEEFRGDRNVVFINEPPPSKANRGALACPDCNCGSAKRSKYGNYVCTNWPYCDFKFLKCNCGDVISVRHRAARCTGCSREYWACWECGRGVIEHRTGRRTVRCTTYRYDDAESCQATKYVDRLTDSERRLVVTRSSD